MKRTVTVAMLAPLVFAAAAATAATGATAGTAAAQQAVPITSEPHHHLAYSSKYIRSFRVEVPGYGETLMHAHPLDYIWISVGAADLVNAVAGKEPAKASAADGSVHFAKGGFAHIARVEGATPFRNVTIELLQPQSNPRNLCEPVLPGAGMNCAVAMKRARGVYSGATVRPELETDQLRVTLLTIAPGATLEIEKREHPVTLVAVDGANGTVQMTCHGGAGAREAVLHAHSGNGYPLNAAAQCALRSSARAPVRFLALEFTAAAQ